MLKINPNFSFRQIKPEAPPAMDGQPLSRTSDRMEIDTCDSIKKQYENNVKTITQFLEDNNSTLKERYTQAFNIFNRRVQAGHFSEARDIEMLHGPAKRSFDSVCNSLGDESIAPDKRLKVAENLAEGVAMCPSGALTNFILADQALNTKGIVNNVSRCWEEMLDQAIVEFARKAHGTEDFYRNNEIHYVNNYRNYLAGTYGVEQRIDPYKMNIKPVECKKYIQPRMIGDALVRLLAEDCLTEVHKRFEGYKNGSLGEKQVGAFYKEYKSGGVELTELYGEIPPNVLVNEHHGADTSHETYTLLDDATLLMPVIAENLRTAGILVSPEFLVVSEGKNKATTIKQLGSNAFFVEMKLEQGGVAHRSLYLEDLPASVNSWKVMDAALSNTSSKVMLANYDPALVWQALANDASPEDLLIRLNQPGIHAFRQANTDHETYLTNKVFETISETNTPNQCQQALLHALRLKENDLALRLINIVDDFDFSDDIKNTALHYAAESGFTQVIAEVAKTIKNINAQNEFGQNAFMLAAHKGHIKVLDALLDAGVTFETGNNEGNAALALAVRNNLRTTIAALSKAGANMNRQDEQGNIALILAAQLSNRDMINALLGAGADPYAKDRQGNSLMMAVVSSGDLDMVSTLLVPGIKVNAKDKLEFNRLLRAAVDANAGKVAAASLAAGADINAQDKDQEDATALMLAAENGNKNMIEWLIGKEANIETTNARGYNALMVAASYGHIAASISLINALINSNSDFNAKKESISKALRVAEQYGHKEMVTFLNDLNNNGAAPSQQTAP